jgi:5-methylcytosine-specific restriction protein A
MATILKKEEWKEILLNKNISNELDLSIFQTLYAFDNHQASASEIGKILGVHYGSLNFEIGRYAKRIAKFYDINFTMRDNKKYKFWDLFFNGWKDRYFIWQLKIELVKALEETGLTGKIQFSDELLIENGKTLMEGMKKTIIVNSYERNPKARELCIKKYGYLCSVCNINFEDIYGEIGKKFIHVHHLVPISKIRNSYQIDPIQDLRPVCPNCHAMLHKRNPPFSIDELKSIIRKESKYLSNRVKLNEFSP